MKSNQTHTVSLEVLYNQKPESVLNLFKDHTVFKLTGANEIHADFRTGGSFSFIFINRGTIYGKFIKIADTEIIMDWNVEGFQRPAEINTLVNISLQENEGSCLLSLVHQHIANQEAALAKQRAWKEILDKINNILIR